MSAPSGAGDAAGQANHTLNGPPGPASPPTAALRTYSLLRLGMVGVVVALGVSVALEVARSDGCVQRSISAYYYTPSRAVFVGALITLGVSMIVLWGKNWVEDGFLNLAGLLAPVVAFVPTSDANFCGVTKASQQAANGDPGQLIDTAHQAIDNNVTTLGLIILGTLLSLVIAVITNSRWAALLRDRPGPWYRDWTFCVPYGLAAVLWMFGAAMFVWKRPTFYDHAHMASAVTLFVFVIVVVSASAWDKWDDWKQHGRRGADPSRRWMIQYGLLAGLMIAAAIVIFVAGKAMAHDWFGIHWVLVIEATLITLFGVFWVLQTIDRRDEGAPRPDPPLAPRS